MLSYGANMNYLTLARREVNVLSRDPAFVLDTNIRMTFKHQGGYATLERFPAEAAAAASTAGSGAASGNGAAAAAGSTNGNGNGVASSSGSSASAASSSGRSVEPGPRHVPYDGHVHGVMYKVTKEDFKRLSKREGGYSVEEITVQTYDGRLHQALAFVTNPLFKLPEEVTPTEGYLSRVREGAADNYLDPGYQAFLSGIPTVPGTGLGPEYFNTPSKYLGYSFLLVCTIITLAYFVQH